MNGCGGCLLLAALCLGGLLVAGPFGLIVGILVFIAIAVASK